MCSLAVIVERDGKKPNNRICKVIKYFCNKFNLPHAWDLTGWMSMSMTTHETATGEKSLFTSINFNSDLHFVALIPAELVHLALPKEIIFDFDISTACVIPAGMAGMGGEG